jgi:tetratricopeptide (TPR) repeat protein
MRILRSLEVVRMRGTLLVVLLIVTAVMGCMSKKEAGCYGEDPGLAIAGCTALIQSGWTSTENTTNAYSRRGVAYAKMGAYDLAIQDFDQAIELRPNEAALFRNRGGTYDYMGEHDRAMQDFDQAIKLDPNDYKSWGARGLSQIYVDQPKEALADCNEAVRLAPPRHPLGLNCRGFAYLKMKQLDSAIAEFDAAQKIAPKSAVAFYGRGLAKRLKGDAAGGNADIATALTIDAQAVSEAKRLGFPG